MAFERTDYCGDEVGVARLTSSSDDLGFIQLGRDVDAGFIYKVLVAVIDRQGFPGHAELMFSVILVDLNADTEEDISDGLATRNFLTGDDRRYCLSLICGLVEHLVRDATSPVLVMNTVTPNLPTKALQKYEEVAAAITRAGYRGGQVDPYHGSRQWLFERVA